MKAAKERKMDRKRKHKALAASKTDKSRQRRLDNKAKRDEIHAIDPDMKVRVINQVTYDNLGTEIMVENGKIKTVAPEIIEPATVEVFTVKEVMEREGMVAPVEVEEVEVEDVGRFKTLVSKWKL